VEQQEVAMKKEKWTWPMVGCDFESWHRYR